MDEEAVTDDRGDDALHLNGVAKAGRGQESRGLYLAKRIEGAGRRDERGDRHVIDGEAMIAAGIIRIAPAQPDLMSRRDVHRKQRDQHPPVGIEIAVQRARRGVQHARKIECRQRQPAGRRRIRIGDHPRGGHLILEEQRLGTGVGRAPLFADIGDAQGIEGLAGVVDQPPGIDDRAGAARGERAERAFAVAGGTEAIKRPSRGTAVAGAVGGEVAVPAGYGRIVRPWDAGAAARQAVEVLVHRRADRRERSLGGEAGGEDEGTEEEK